MVLRKLAFGSYMTTRLIGCLTTLVLTGFISAPVARVVAAEPAASNNAESTASSQPPAGHSMHGEAFNDGPRQTAYLMGGTGRVSFPITTTSARAQSFFDQGIGQLHGFWYWEAERSFRQVAAIDPGCAMAYWGMAAANVNNRKRATGFIREAVERKENAGRRERLYIEALAGYYEDLDKEHQQFEDDKKPAEATTENANDEQADKEKQETER